MSPFPRLFCAACLLGSALLACSQPAPSSGCQTNADCSHGSTCNKGKCYLPVASGAAAGSTTSNGNVAASSSSSGGQGGSSTSSGSGSGGWTDSGTSTGGSGWTNAGTTSSGGSAGGGCSCSSSCCSQIGGDAGITCPDGKPCYGTVPDGGGWFYCNDQTGKCDPFDPCNGASGTWTCQPTSGGSGGGGTTGSPTVDPTGISFVVVGDTRPDTTCDSSSGCAYPTSTISSIYSDFNNLTPKPLAVIATGDFQYDSGNSSALWQIQQYELAVANYTVGPTFPALGNHECNQSDLGACDTSIQNYQAFMQMLVDLKLVANTSSLPYYSESVTAPNGDSATFAMVAANTWDSVSGPQGTWLSSTLSQSTSTFNFVVRHQSDDDSTCSDATANDNTTNSCPAIADVQTIINQNPNRVTLKLNGHTHEIRFDTYNDAIISGSGGVAVQCTPPSTDTTYCASGSTPGGFIYCQELTDHLSLVCNAYDVTAGLVTLPGPFIAKNGTPTGTLAYGN